jgi:endoglucanase
MVIEEHYFARIAEAGFDTVRVPIRWSAHAETEPPYTIDETFFERVDWVIDEASAQGLNVVINMHHYNALFSQPAEHRERFLAMWRQIATRYRHRPDNLYYEPLNEPHDKLTVVGWNKLIPLVTEVIREVDGVHTLVFGPAEWGGVGAFPQLKLPEGEENVVCAVHYYAPMLFTHQGASWSGDGYQTLGVIWPGPPEKELTPDDDALKLSWVATWFEGYNTEPTERNPAGPRPILDDLNWADKQAKRFDCPVWLGEFGAYEKADMASRVRWTTFVREEAEKRGWAWAYWEFGAGFGVYDRTREAYREELLRALIPE